MCIPIVIVVNIYVEIFTNEAEHKSSADQSHTDTKLTTEGEVLVFNKQMSISHDLDIEQIPLSNICCW